MYRLRLCRLAGLVADRLSHVSGVEAHGSTSFGSGAVMDNEKVTALTLEVTTIAHRLIDGEKLAEDHPYAWLMEFDGDDLKDFIHDVTRTFKEFSGLPTTWPSIG